MGKNYMCQNSVGKGKSNLLRRLKADWKRRNWVTNVVLYGVQIASAFYGLLLLTDIFLRTLDNLFFEELSRRMPFGEFLWHEFYKGYIPGMLISVLVMIGNNRIIRWKADGLFWMFLSMLVVCSATLFVEAEAFLWFTGISILSLLLYAVALWLPKRVEGQDTNTFRQCRKPSNALVTASYLAMLLWLFLIYDAVVML